MKLSIFEMGIDELRAFFNTFKPAPEQLAVWYERLKNFDDDAWRLAVYRTTENTATNPNYQTLKQALFNARNSIDGSKAIQKIKADGGFAAQSNEKWEFERDCMKELARVFELDIPKKQKDIQFNDLKLLWESGYKELPNYKSEAEIQKMIDAEMWLELKALGWLTEIPKNTELYIPLFRDEKNSSIEVRYS